MSKLWLGQVILFVTALSANLPVMAQSFWKGTDQQIISQYLSILEDFKAKSCTSDQRRKFDQYLEDYQKRGHFVPSLSSGKWDVDAVKKSLPLLKEKLAWIQTLSRDLPKSFHRQAEIERLSLQINELLNVKRKYRLAKAEEKKSIVDQSQRAMKQFSADFSGFLKTVPFLLSFRHPVNHLKNRMEYQQAVTTQGRADENKLLFFRRILEDGTFDKDHSNRDYYLRSTLDTIVIRLAQNEEFLREDLRYDLEWVLGEIRRHLNRGRDKQRERLSVWQERVEEALDFYGRLAAGKIPADFKKGFSRATFHLRDFVYDKHVEAYRYFSRQPEIIQALFAYDQILLNEVGQATVENYRERKDVAQVVWNRRGHQEYSQISSTEPLYQKTGRIKTADFPWLNVLFKEGEFSFTYYFMPAVVNVFCPDFYKTAKETRMKNLYLALDVLKNPRKDFKALRYFSRESMTGRIDMSQIWDHHERIHERPGRKRKNTDDLKTEMAKKDYRYLYSFTSPAGKQLDVIEIGSQTFSVAGFPDEPVFYNYRNPHKFSFFAETERAPTSEP